MRQVCSFTDFLVVCSGESSRQIEAIRDTISKTLKEAQVAPHHAEGNAASGWVLLDYGDVVIHIFGAAQRDYYRLDDLWDKAVPVVKFQ